MEEIVERLANCWSCDRGIGEKWSEPCISGGAQGSSEPGELSHRDRRAASAGRCRCSKVGVHGRRLLVVSIFSVKYGFSRVIMNF